MEAAEVLKLTAKDLIKIKVIDEIVEEPLGGAHRDYDEAAHLLKKTIVQHLSEIENIERDELVLHRQKRFAGMGEFFIK